MAIRHILFPGRHHLLTCFQGEALRAAVVEHAPGGIVVFAVTSADHGNTRRNPVPGHRREAQVERFLAIEGLAGLCFLIDDVAETERFAEHVLAAIEVDGGPRLTPEDTLVAVSTPAVIALYERLGFGIVPMELAADGSFTHARPWDLLERAVADGLAAVEDAVHPASLELWERYGLQRRARRIHADPLLSAEGELTETRDYNTYARAFDTGAARKWALVAPHVRPGRIVDVGCGAGSLLEQAAADPRLRESDLYGIEAARPLYEECVHRRRAGAFANPNTFFHQRNLLSEQLFDPASVDTTLTVALCHELYSYLGEDALLGGIAQIHRQTALGGVWICADVCGPSDPDRAIWLALSGPPPGSAFTVLSDPTPAALVALSPAESFLQFAADWRPGGPRPEFELLEHDGAPVVATDLRTAMEWLSKRDYVDNWASEMQESFCFWTPQQWERAAADAGFQIDPLGGGYVNRWLVENRFSPTCSLHPEGDLTRRLDWPVTHILLVARRATA